MASVSLVGGHSHAKRRTLASSHRVRRRTRDGCSPVREWCAALATANTNTDATVYHESDRPTRQRTTRVGSRLRITGCRCSTRRGPSTTRRGVGTKPGSRRVIAPDRGADAAFGTHREQQHAARVYAQHVPLESGDLFVREVGTALHPDRINNRRRSRRPPARGLVRFHLFGTERSGCAAFAQPATAGAVQSASVLSSWTQIVDQDGSCASGSGRRRTWS